LKIPFEETIDILRQLIRIPSFSKAEEKRADHFEKYLSDKKLPVQRFHNNLFVRNLFFDPGKETILLNSHLDTVQAGEHWTMDPFDPVISDGRLYGLGTNDAGGALLSLMSTFLFFYDQKDLRYNLVYLASAEEEVSGANGITSVLPELPLISFGIVGEPTGMQLAVAEKGLMVLDCMARGKSGHAARGEGINAIELAIEDIEWIRRYKFPKASKLLGDAKMTVTMIQAGSQHNVIPDECRFVVDVRSTDAYSNEEILEIINNNLRSEVKARSTRLQPSSLNPDHLLVETARSMGIPLFGSSTLSDQSLMSFPTAKIGPGESARSHTANEYIMLEEIREGIGVYVELLDKLLKKDPDSR
jgi:acetylornithine deacetylase